ncbi:MAG TPA: winged helix-turn-helix domain-containing protein [Candidatus Bathyarchaeia archaeon]|nr:winged helix-turn-helix domain-containing protein [Candidatus Bathyarchaeia archaeon]
MSNKGELSQEQLSVVFSALGNPVRLKILAIINETKRPLHIKAVAKALQMDYAAVYRHVDVLKRAGLVQIFEVGRSRVLSPLHPDLVREILSLAQQIEHE